MLLALPQKGTEGTFKWRIAIQVLHCSKSKFAYILDQNLIARGTIIKASLGLDIATNKFLDPSIKNGSKKMDHLWITQNVYLYRLRTKSQNWQFWSEPFFDPLFN